LRKRKPIRNITIRAGKTLTPSVSII
jgi:hypothetical protein